MVPGFDDIIFEKLNKEYGAYFLRKRYSRVLGLSVILAVIIGCAAVIIPFLMTPQQGKEIYPARYVIVENLMPPDENGGTPPPAPPPAPPPPKGLARQIKTDLEYIAPEVVDTILPIEKALPSSADSLTGGKEDKGVTNGTAEGTGSVSGGESGTGKGGEGGDGTGNGLYTKVDEMPTFKGGDIDKFREWVQKKTKYPQEAMANGVQGKVYITFVIERDGSVSNVKVARGVDPLIDNEALKAVASSPRWTPGKRNGKTVRVSYYIPVNFEL